MKENFEGKHEKIEINVDKIKLKKLVDLADSDISLDQEGQHGKKYKKAEELAKEIFDGYLPGMYENMHNFALYDESLKPVWVDLGEKSSKNKVDVDYKDVKTATQALWKIEEKMSSIKLYPDFDEDKYEDVRKTVFGK
jgi:hypothetical protein